MPGLQIFDGSSWRAIGVQDSYWDVMTATSGGSSVSLSWPNAGNSPVSYDVDIDGTVTNVGNVTSYVPSGLSVGNSYTFKVRPVFADGSTGGWSLFKTGGPDGFNRASGGTETTISNYNGTGETWKIHQFSSSGSLSITDSPGINSFKVLIVAGGGGGGHNAGDVNKDGGGGGAGGLIYDASKSISAGNYSITVGLGQSGKGQDSVAFGLTAVGGGAGGSPYGGAGGSGGGGGNWWGGGGGGSATSGQGNNGSAGGNGDSGGKSGGGGGAGGAGGQQAGGAGLSVNITGSSITYASGGWGGTRNANVPQQGTDGRGNGGGGQRPGLSRARGGHGTVIVAYRIA